MTEAAGVMKTCISGGITLHWREDGAPDGPAIVFANSLGTDLRLWDKVVALLPRTLRLIRYDKRGHGLSDAPRGPYPMGALVTDAERLIEEAGAGPCVFVGCSIGGMIAQGLAVKRPDLVRALVLSNTATKIGTPDIWQDRIAAVETGGIEAVADAVMERWFSPAFRATPELRLWRNMLTAQPARGYAGCAAAISGTDLTTPTSGLDLPTLVIAGSEDGSTPPDLVAELAGLIKGARAELIRVTGHLPCVEAPEAFEKLLTEFLRDLDL